MAMVNCPSCKKIVSDVSQKCPNCGASLKSGAAGKDNPAYKKLHMIASALIIVSFVLLFLDLFEVAKTYVGSIVLGCGFGFEGFAQAAREKAEGSKGKSKIIIGIGAIILIGGIVFMYFDLTLPR